MYARPSDAGANNGFQMPHRPRPCNVVLESCSETIAPCSRVVDVFRSVKLSPGLLAASGKPRSLSPLPLEVPMLKYET
eukprot:scaffold234103_cov33-Tisochrysis_lutea.AAC.1